MTKGTGKGTGLGLSVIHGIVKNYEGAIQVDSEPGRGSDFYIYLPVIEKVTIENNPNVPVSLQGGNEVILLIDDEEPVVRVTGKRLNKMGYQVVTTTDAKKALDIF